jgi:LPXTG-site transpeptidase (sortase) family protein
MTRFDLNNLIRNIKIFKKKKICLLILALIAITLVVILCARTLNDNRNFKQRPTVASNDATENSVSCDFCLTIKKLNIEAPIIRGVDPSDEIKYNDALQNGVVHMIGTALPGSNSGNIFIYGHSSAKNNPKYGDVFAGLDDLKFGDEIKINYKNEEYEYTIRERKIIEKNDFSVLEQTSSEQVTLMTCWPIGTEDHRIVVIAERK